MSWKPPINRRANRAILNDEYFFKKLYQKCARFNDKEHVFLTYMAIVSLVGEELRRRDMCRLPHLGDFGLIHQKSRPGLCGPQRVKLLPRKVLKFYVKDRFRRYFAERNRLY